MTWDQVRSEYPDQWVLMEALEAHSDGGHRILDAMRVLSPFEDSGAAMRRYAELHSKDGLVEYYVLHTSRAQLGIRERIRFSPRFRCPD